MSKILPILLALALYLTPLYPVYAQDSASTTPSVKRVRPAAASAAAKLQEAKDKMEDRKEAAMDKMENARDKMATRAAELKARLARFRDKAKATRVENVNSNLNAINQRRSSHMQQVLNRLQSVLAKIKTWVSQQEAEGKDMASLKEIITSTEAAWAEADAAVKAQTDKDYTIVVNSESTVKADAMEARNNLHNDLKIVHDKLSAVRQNLVSALRNWKGNN